MRWNEGRIECHLRLLSDWIVVGTRLIAIMKDQVEHLNKIGVAAAAMMGEDVNEAVKSGSSEIV